MTQRDAWLPILCNVYGFTSQEIIRGADGAFEVRVAARSRAGNWPSDRRNRALRAGASALRYTGWRGDADPARRADAIDRDHGVPMIRLLFTIIAGVLLGGNRPPCQRAGIAAHCHPGRLFASCAAYETERGYLAPATRSEQRAAAVMDPAFAVAVCRYDLSGGPIKLAVPVSQAYTSVSFYTRNEVAYYAINDRSAGRS